MNRRYRLFSKCKSVSGKRRVLVVFFLAVCVFVFVGILVFREYVHKASTTNLTNGSYVEINLPSHSRGDFIDPGPIEKECQEDMDRWLSQNYDKYANCVLVSSRVGLNEKECPYGLSVQGCTLCKIRCQEVDSSVDETRRCTQDSDCVLKTGCYCGCFNKNYKSEMRDSLFCTCVIPDSETSCKCVHNICQ